MTIRIELETDYGRLVEENARLRKALEIYADPGHWYGDSQNTMALIEVDEKGWTLAERVLAGIDQDAVAEKA